MTISGKIKLLNDASLESLNAKNEAEIIQKFTRAGIKIIGAAYGFGWYKSQGKHDFNLAYVSPKTPYAPRRPRKTGGINARVQTRGQPIFVTDVETAPYIKKDALTHMRGVAAVPMIYKNSSYGNIILCYRGPHQFSEEEKSLCAALGTGAAQAITINRLYSGMENLVNRRTRQLKLSNLKLKRDKVSDEAVLASIGEGLIGTDRQGRVIFANPAAEMLLGRKKDDILGRSLYESQMLVDAEGRSVPLEKRPTYLSLNKGCRVANSALSYIGKNKRSVPCAITATPIILNGNIIGSIQVFRDISQEREVDRVKTELISLASHQLRTPLSAINWYTEALVKEEIGRLNPGQKKYLGQIRDANQKMIRLVYDFLNVSRIELGTFTVKLSQLDAAALARETVREINPLLEEKELRLKQTYGRGLGSLEADQKILRVILQNLITNAVKYTPPKGKIEVRLDLPRPGLLRLVVKDNGHGIPKEQQAKIFSKLFRADNAAKLDAGGSGLGLYLVKSFIDLCGGKISFTSKENKGTAFTVMLPVKRKGESI
jgi:PAS domain S-box-containing protein